MYEPPFSPAADRNKGPILRVLREILPPRGAALEIASGTGQHVSWFAAGMPGWTWQPTDADASALPAIAQWVSRAGVDNVRPPLRLDVMAAPWPGAGAAFGQDFDAIFCANLLHISPWPACPALMLGSARHLAAGGVLVTYGPYLEDGVATAASNLAFDRELRARNPQWGIRRLAEVQAEGLAAGLALRQRYAMPANNLLLVFGSSESAG